MGTKNIDSLPVIVLGCPRSGTSTVARILHTKLGVCMGHIFRAPDDRNPEGYYEDKVMAKALDGLRRGGITPSMWRLIMAVEHEEANCDKEFVGVKHPLYSLIAASTIEKLGFRRVIVTKREPKEDVINSVVKYTDRLWHSIREQGRSEIINFTKDTAAELYFMYASALDRLEGKHIVYLGPGKTPDEEVERQLREVLK